MFGENRGKRAGAWLPVISLGHSLPARGTLKKCIVLAFPPKKTHLTGRPNAKTIAFFFGAGGK